MMNPHGNLFLPALLQVVIALLPMGMLCCPAGRALMTSLHCFSSSAVPSAAAMCLETPPLPHRVPFVGFTRAVTACSVRLPCTTYARTHS